jgi:2-polyprenyl-3-methyl-5-hydroxy-6-metoxy-1,4-benzoquinol methylase
MSDPPSVPERLKRSVVEHYEGRLKEHGPTARGMDWKDEASQRLRFEILCAVADLDGKSVCEIGCGAGHLVDWLAERGIAARYSGIDLSEEMLAAARRRHPGVLFEHRDILVGDEPGAYDVVLCSGLFHVKLDHHEEEWKRFVGETIRRMYSMCRLGIAFNLMTDQVDFRSPTLYYASPAETLELCRRELSRFVVLRHDYPLYEFTVYVYRESPVG